ncbi:hypothetical protein PPERSA_12907 [Pseudocohnilembus persalinus]|uniref:Uncharacterized protein n=1 Tax=Pseudocohnilembus persalinus TaxID=266149 RepID=A0A0V0R281_PSEPJ|nr:hypothetical protein PPERSA_12907 [Pseudocohnilembus persalinus]|eukprot:KRX08426.1 hypothetical protein PPERSA_12907 [Pseudocohnilembus persalinus]
MASINSYAQRFQQQKSQQQFQQFQQQQQQMQQQTQQQQFDQQRQSLSPFRKNSQKMSNSYIIDQNIQQNTCNPMNNSSNIITKRQQGQLVSSDKEQYIQYLETQMEKLQNMVQQQVKIEKSQGSVRIQLDEHAEKFQNITNLIKLLQQFAESQEDENNSIKTSLKQIFQQQGIQSHQHQQVQQEQLENRSQTEKIVEFMEKLSNDNDQLKGQMEVLQQNFGILEDNIRENIQNFENQANQTISQLTQDLAIDMKTLEQQLQEGLNKKMDIKDQLQEDVNQYFDDFRKEFNKKIEIVMNEVQQSALRSDLTENERKLYKLNKNFNEMKEKLEQKGYDLNQIKQSSQFKSQQSVEQVPKSRPQSKSPQNQDLQKNIILNQSREITDLKLQVETIQGKLKSLQKKLNSQQVTQQDIQVLKENYIEKFGNKIYWKIMKKLSSKGIIEKKGQNKEKETQQQNQPNQLFQNNNQQNKKRIKSKSKSLSQNRSQQVQAQSRSLSNNNKNNNKEKIGKKKQHVIDSPENFQQFGVNGMESFGINNYNQQYGKSEKKNDIFQNEILGQKELLKQNDNKENLLYYENQLQKEYPRNSLSSKALQKDLDTQNLKQTKKSVKKQISPFFNKNEKQIITPQKSKTLEKKGHLNNKKHIQQQIQNKKQSIVTDPQFEILSSEQKNRGRSQILNKMIHNSYERSRSHSHKYCETCRSISYNSNQKNNEKEQNAQYFANQLKQQKQAISSPPKQYTEINKTVRSRSQKGLQKQLSIQGILKSTSPNFQNIQKKQKNSKNTKKKHAQSHQLEVTPQNQKNELKMKSPLFKQLKTQVTSYTNTHHNSENDYLGLSQEYNNYLKQQKESRLKELLHKKKKKLQNKENISNKSLKTGSVDRRMF